MAVSSAVSAFKQGLLRHLRVPLQQQTLLGSAAAVGTSLSLWRGFAGGGYLDKDEVTQRVLEVTKHFEKIDPAKVRLRPLCPPHQCCPLLW
jgi:NADH dehydrogenase (ubiquinone) 1 alpha/beta subcomplex 1